MDANHWDQVIEEVGPRLYRYFKHKGANDLASDLTQETFLRLVRTSEKYDASKGPVICYALGVAQNIWREGLRKIKPFDDLENIEIISEYDIHEELEKLDNAKKLKRIIRNLPAIQQDILYFYFDEEITTREIAEILEIPEGTVKSHLHRSKDHIRSLFMKESP